MKRRLAILFALTALAGALSGCRTSQHATDAAADQKPWNAPAAWEGMIWGVPY